VARTIVEIPDPLLREIDALRERLGISRAEAVRRALRDWLQQRDAAPGEGFGLWARHVADPAELHRRLRDAD